MPFQSGQKLSAARLNRLQPKTYWAQCTSAVNGVQTDTDIPGATVTFTTETAGAEVTVEWVADHRQTGAQTGQSATHAIIDGATLSPVFTIYGEEVATDRGTMSQQWVTTIATPGSHTIKLRVTQLANHQINIYTTIKVTVKEVV